MSYDVPVEDLIPGDPGRIEATADRFAATLGAHVRDATDAAEAARTTAAAGWHGPAGDAFGSAVHDARTRVEGLGPVGPAVATLLRDHATRLRGLQRELGALQQQWRAAQATVQTLPAQDPATETAGRHLASLTRQMRTVIAAGDELNETTARAVEDLTTRIASTPYDPLNQALTIASYQSGAMAGHAQQAAEDILGQGPVSQAWKIGSRSLSPITAALSEGLADADNPNYSVAERLGRAGAKAVFNGGPDILGGIVGGFAGAAVAGPLGALAGGAAGATAVDDVMSSLPFADDVIDAVGQGVDDAATATGLEEP